MIPAETRHAHDNCQPLIAEQLLPPSHMIYTENKIRAVWECPTRQTIPSPHGEEKVAPSASNGVLSFLSVLFCPVLFAMVRITVFSLMSAPLLVLLLPAVRPYCLTGLSDGYK